MHRVTPAGDVSTFIQNSSWGRPIGIDIGPTGIVVISDESNGALYAIFENGSSATLYSGSPLISQESPRGVSEVHSWPRCRIFGLVGNDGGCGAALDTGPEKALRTRR